MLSRYKTVNVHHSHLCWSDTNIVEFHHKFHKYIIQEFTDSEDTGSQKKAQKTSHFTEQAEQFKGWTLMNTVIAELFEENVNLQEVIPAEKQHQHSIKTWHYLVQGRRYTKPGTIRHEMKLIVLKKEKQC